MQGAFFGTDQHGHARQQHPAANVGDCLLPHVDQPEGGVEHETSQRSRNLSEVRLVHGSTHS